MVISYSTIISEIANLEKVSFSGNEQGCIGGFCSITNLKENCITWVKRIDSETTQLLREVKGLLIVSQSIIPEVDADFLLTDNPKKVFFEILNHFWGEENKPYIGKTSIVKGQLGENVIIGEHCFIDEGVIIGEGSILEHNIVLKSGTSIGKECIIHSGVVIGTDGFGFFKNDDDSWGKVPHFGGVIIGNCVEIGANTCIDRGTIENTEIGDNVKIDNLCHIAHNVKIQENSLVIAGAIICGSAYLGKNAYIAPGGIVRNQCKLGENSFVGLGGVVVNDVGKNVLVAGVPAKKIRDIQPGEK